MVLNVTCLTDGIGGRRVALASRSTKGCFVADSASFTNVDRILDDGLRRTTKWTLSTSNGMVGTKHVFLPF